LEEENKRTRTASNLIEKKSSCMWKEIHYGFRRGFSPPEKEDANRDIPIENRFAEGGRKHISQGKKRGGEENEEVKDGSITVVCGEYGRMWECRNDEK